MSAAIELRPRVSYPRRARSGAKYVVTVDLDHGLTPDAWPYDLEEYPVTCFLDAAPHFTQETTGDPTIVVHRFGGSYGPARFVLKAGAPALAAIRLTLVNGAGVPIVVQTLRDIEIAEAATPLVVRALTPEAAPVQLSARPASSRAEPQVAPVRDRYALLIGVDRHMQSRLSPLRYCANDAQALASLFEQSGYRNTVLLNEQATRRAIVQALDKLCADSDSDDLIVVFFAGHAYHDDKRGYLVPYDFEQPETDGVGVDAILDMAERARRRLLLLGDAVNRTGGSRAGIGVIGGVTSESVDLERGLFADAVIQAITAAAGSPLTIGTLAESIMGYIRGGERATAGLDQSKRQGAVAVLGPGVTDLVVIPPPDAVSATAEREVSEPLRRARPGAGAPAGYDPDFLRGFRVPLPRVVEDVELEGGTPRVLTYEHFSIIMSLRRTLAHLVAVNSDLNRRVRIPQSADPEWFVDERIRPQEQLGLDFYARSGFHRARLVKRLQPAWGSQSVAARAATSTNVLCNIVPMVPMLNQHRAWVDLPDFVATRLATDGRTLMFAGPVFSPNDPSFRGVQVPRAYWRIFCFMRESGEPASIAFLATQNLGAGDESTKGAVVGLYQVHVFDVEKLTRILLGDLLATDAAVPDRFKATGQVLGVAAKQIRTLSEILESLEAPTRQSRKDRERDKSERRVDDVPLAPSDIDGSTITPSPVDRPSQYLFYLSYAQGDKDKYLREFFMRLDREVRALTGSPDGLGFFSRDRMVAGDNLSDATAKALGSSRVLVAIISPRYVNSRLCGQEWQLFLDRARRAGSNTIGILPVPWVPVRRELPSALRRVQLTGGELPEIYLDKGLRYFTQRERHRTDYRHVVRWLAQRLLELGETAAPSGEIPDVAVVPNAFERAVAPAAVPAATSFFEIEILPASHGQSLLINYGHADHPRRVLVDCGPRRTGGVLRERLRTLPSVERLMELLILTHADDDRIGGAISLLQDTSSGISYRDIWFNGWMHVASTGGSL